FGAGAGSNISRLRHQRNAASVLPLPVGASRSVDSPSRMAAQPLICAGVGCSNAPANQSRTAGRNGASAGAGVTRPSLRQDGIDYGVTARPTGWGTPGETSRGRTPT